MLRVPSAEEGPRLRVLDIHSLKVRHGIFPVGFWTTLVGESSNELAYILPWESPADRETRWTANPSRHEGRASYLRIVPSRLGACDKKIYSPFRGLRLNP
ncbi:MAG TPA: NIPSNAP family protein [Xanthobacteraceae bacterium]|nr:NIPSNAP family protein [Xanthobacteraceae bacterium]